MRKVIKNDFAWKWHLEKGAHPLNVWWVASERATNTKTENKRKKAKKSKYMIIMSTSLFRTNIYGIERAARVCVCAVCSRLSEQSISSTTLSQSIFNRRYYAFILNLRTHSNKANDFYCAVLRFQVSHHCLTQSKAQCTRSSILRIA